MNVDNKHASILVVDDDGDVRDSVHMLLENEGLLIALQIPILAMPFDLAVLAAVGNAEHRLESHP